MSNKLYALAVKLLARREHSCRELQVKLLQRGYDHALIMQVLGQLQQQQLQSDSRFTEMYIHARKQRGYGPQRIRAELQQRGISDEIIHDAINVTSHEWLQIALQVQHKKFGVKPANGSIIQQKNFLHYRGFELDTINQVVKQ